MTLDSFSFPFSFYPHILQCGCLTSYVEGSLYVTQMDVFYFLLLLALKRF